MLSGVLSERLVEVVAKNKVPVGDRPHVGGGGDSDTLCNLVRKAQRRIATLGQRVSALFGRGGSNYVILLRACQRSNWQEVIMPLIRLIVLCGCRIAAWQFR